MMRLGAAMIGAAALLLPAAASAMTLSEALDRALKIDPQMAILAAQYQVEREDGRQERAGLLPVISAQAGYDTAKTDSAGVFGDTSDRYDAWSARATLRQPLFRLDWFARLRRAKALDAVAALNLEDRSNQLMIRVAERYFGVLTARVDLEQAIAEARAIRESLDDTKKRYEVELVAGTDLKEAQARDDLAQARLLSAREALEAAQDALQESTGAGNARLPSLPDEVVFPALSPADPQAWVERARNGNAAIRGADLGVKVAVENVGTTRSSGLPELDLVASVSHDDTSEYTFGQEQDDARVGVLLTVPIYAGGINSSALREARANQHVAEAQRVQVRAETERVTRRTFRQVQTGYAQVRAFTVSRDSAMAAETATKHGYDAGTRTITDVLDAKSRVAQAERELAAARYNLLLNLLRLKQLAGTLSEQDFAEIDALLR